jgi:hypothetical protein
LEKEVIKLQKEKQSEIEKREDEKTKYEKKIKELEE